VTDWWAAITSAISSFPPLLRYAVMPVGRKVWLPILVRLKRFPASSPSDQRWFSAWLFGAFSFCKALSSNGLKIKGPSGKTQTKSLPLPRTIPAKGAWNSIIFLKNINIFA
jgi:hypothetical protein